MLVLRAVGWTLIISFEDGPQMPWLWKEGCRTPERRHNPSLSPRARYSSPGGDMGDPVNREKPQLHYAVSVPARAEATGGATRPT